MNRFTLLLTAILFIISSNGLAATSSESKTPPHVLKDLLHETNTKNENLRIWSKSIQTRSK